MKSKLLRRATLPLFAIAAALPLRAATVTTLYSTGFDAPTYSDGVLLGQDGWVASSGTGTNNLTVANSATDGTITLAATGEDLRRLFTPAQTTGSVFLSADINVATAAATGDYFIHLGDGSTSNFYARTYIRSSGAGFVMALGTSSGAVTYGTTVLSFGTNYSLLVRYDINAGPLNDTGALFINPITVDGTGDTPYVAATTVGTDATTIGSVSLRQGGASNAAGLTVDNIAVFTVPEPATALLGAVGLLGLLRRRR